MNSLLDDFLVPKRVLPIIFIVETSGGMFGERIDAVNKAIKSALPLFQEVSEKNADAELKVAILEYGTGARWMYNELIAIPEFEFLDLQASGLVDFGEALTILNEKLSRKTGFLNIPTGCYAPILILINLRGFTDNWQSALESLKQNKWFEASLKLGINIDSEEEEQIISFTGSYQSVVKLDSATLESFFNRLPLILNLFFAGRPYNSNLKPGYTTQDELNYYIKEIADTIDRVSIASDLNESNN